jgi:hypothetical protein
MMRSNGLISKHNGWVDGNECDLNEEGCLVLPAQNAEVVLGVLVEVLDLDDVATLRRVLRHGHIALVPAAGIGCPMARVGAGSRATSRLARGILLALRPERPSAGTLVQDVPW